jgi:hypothetical protein
VFAVKKDHLKAYLRHHNAPFKNSAKLAELQQLVIKHVMNPPVHPFSPNFDLKNTFKS